MPDRDWRSKAAYDDLNTAPLRMLAWEYLRRNPDYVREYRDSITAPDAATDDATAARWGLRFPGGSCAQRQDSSDLLGAHRGPCHHSLVGIAAVLLASIVSCASGCDLVTTHG